MKEELANIGEALRAATTAFILPIQTTRQIDDAAFANLHEQAVRLVRGCKGLDDVPKALLHELFATYTIVRAEAPAFGARREALEDMASKIEVCFRLILADKLPSERQPGVPRII